MSENNCIPHIRLPRSLLDNDLWINLPLGYREVFLVILDHICFRPQKFDDHGNVVELLIGQVCTTIREITKWLGKFGDKNIVERAIKKFILYEFVSQEVRHAKSILTITHKDTYELIKRASETRSETILRQDQDNIETETKNVKNVKNEKNIISREALNEKNEDLNSSENEKQKIPKKTKKEPLPKVSFRDNVLLTQTQHEKLLAEFGQIAVDWMLDKLSNQQHSTGSNYKSHYHAIHSWVKDAYLKSKIVNLNNSNSGTTDLRRVKDKDGNPVKNPYLGSF